MSKPSGNLKRTAWNLTLAITIGLFAHPQPKLVAQDDEAQPAQSSKRFIAVCSTTQIADFAKQVTGDRWEIVCVLSPGEDPHTYETGNDDLMSVKRADLCLENGWNLEGHSWMRNLAKSASKPIATCVAGIDPLKLTEESGEVNDPHAWFSTNNAIIYVNNVVDAVSKIDPSNADQYRTNADAYIIKLRELNHWIGQQVNAIPRGRRILVTHHDAFGYFSKAYGFKAVSPVGWTTGEMAGVAIDQRQKIVEQIRSLGVKSIFVESSVNSELLDGIAKDTGISVGGELYSDAMGESGSAGETYIGMMRENVKTIVEHLK
ncbi:MAG: metal ABC transporter solute-binding protein, Zn/Mn family [Mariniblastus sp.]